MQKIQQFVPKIPISDQKLPNTAINYPILLTNTHFLPKKLYMFAKKTLFQKPNAKKNNNSCQKYPFLTKKLPNTARNYPILLTNTHFLPKKLYMFAKKPYSKNLMQKKQQFVPKIPISDQKLPNTARNYPILLTNTQFLPKKFYMFAKKT